MMDLMTSSHSNHTLAADVNDLGQSQPIISAFPATEYHTITLYQLS